MLPLDWKMIKELMDMFITLSVSKYVIEINLDRRMTNQFNVPGTYRCPGRRDFQ